jgi:hypothetical protein
VASQPGDIEFERAGPGERGSHPEYGCLGRCFAHKPAW